MARRRRLTLRYRDATHEPGPSAPHPDVVAGFEQLGYRVVGLMAPEVVPGGVAALAADYDDPVREAMLEHGGDPQTLLLSPDARTVARVSWFWSWPGVDLFSVTPQGSRVETHWRWDEVPPWPRRMARARRFATLDGELGRSAGRGRSVRAVPDADPMRLHEAHLAHVAARTGGGADDGVPLPATVAGLVPLYTRAQDHARAVAERGTAVVRYLSQVVLLAAALVFYGVLLSGHPVAAVGWLLATTVAYVVLQPRLAVRAFYTRWWRPAYR